MVRQLFVICRQPTFTCLRDNKIVKDRRSVFDPVAEKLSMAFFVLWSNNPSRNSGARSRSASGTRTIRISQFATEASDTEASGLSSGIDESRT